jgi:hypothetical protein
VTAAEKIAGPSRAGLLEKLMAAVRPEFRVDVFLPDPDDPVLGYGVCSVPTCDSPNWQGSMCSGHRDRWRARGRPELSEFLANPGRPLVGRSEPQRCRVDNCRFSCTGYGMCQRHHGRWQRSGRPDPIVWAAAAPPVASPDRRECLLPFCGLWVESNSDRSLYCLAHTCRWRQLGRPEPEQYIMHCQLRGLPRFDFRALPPQLKLELQYAVQCRHDEQTAKMRTAHVRQAIHQARDAGVDSLLDLPGRQANGRRSGAQKILDYARDVVEMLDEGNGWEAEYPRDVWRVRRLPGLRTTAGSRPQQRTELRFDRIHQPWLRALAKRFMRLRLTSGGPPRQSWRPVRLVLSGPEVQAHVTGGTLPRTHAEERSRSKNVSFPSYTMPPIPSWRASHP